MKIVVSGGWSYGNIGDEAIATATDYLLKKSFPGVPVRYTAYDPADFLACHGLCALPSVHKTLSGAAPETLSFEAVMADPARYGLGEFSAQLDEDTLFIMSGGGYFTEGWKSQFVARLAEIAIARKKGAKVALIGQSIGPVFTRQGRQLLKQQLDECAFLCVRDTSTRDFLKSLELRVPVGLAPDVANVIADILPAAAPENVVNIMPAGYSGYVSVDQTRQNNPLMEKIKKRLSPAGIRYQLQLRALVRQLAKEYSLRFVLSTRWSWDRKFVDYLCRGLEQDRYAVVGCEDTRQLCESLSAGRFLISTKMHPIIISASYSIPAIGIAYNFKVDDYMHSIGAEERCFRIDRVNAKQMLQAMRQAKPVDADPVKGRVYEMMAQLARICGE